VAVALTATPRLCTEVCLRWAVGRFRAGVQALSSRLPSPWPNTGPIDAVCVNAWKPALMLFAIATEPVGVRAGRGDAAGGQPRESPATQPP